MKKKFLILFLILIGLLLILSVSVAYMNGKTLTLKGTSFAYFEDYEYSYNTCALFVQDLVDSGTLKDGDSVWYYPNTVIISQRTGDKFSKSIKTDIADRTDENIISNFNRLYDNIPSVIR